MAGLVLSRLMANMGNPIKSTGKLDEVEEKLKAAASKFLEGYSKQEKEESGPGGVAER